MTYKRELFIFGIVGAVSTFIHFASLFLLVEYFAIPPVTANFFAFLASLLGSFGLNHRYTFRSRLHWKKTLPKYIITILIGFFLNQSIMWISVEKAGISYLYGFLFVTIAVPVSNFLLHKFWTFADR